VGLLSLREKMNRAGSVEGLPALQTKQLTPSLEGDKPAGSVEGLQALQTKQLTPSLEGRGRG